jgi:hypothetical protein
MSRRIRNEKLSFRRVALSMPKWRSTTTTRKRITNEDYGGLKPACRWQGPIRVQHWAEPNDHRMIQIYSAEGASLS